MDAVNRKNRKGGGLAIIHKNNIKVKRRRAGATRSFEYALWTVCLKSVSLSVLAIYRPPYSEVHRVSIKSFCDEIGDFLVDVSLHNNNLIVMGDLNIYIDDQEDTVAKGFLEIMEALGMSQHVTSATHNAGHMLDQIYTETDGSSHVPTQTTSQTTVQSIVSWTCQKRTSKGRQYHPKIQRH